MLAWPGRLCYWQNGRPPLRSLILGAFGLVARRGRTRQPLRLCNPPIVYRPKSRVRIRFFGLFHAEL
jgi:hypothetical protein